MEERDILDSVTPDSGKRRRNLLPTWIKVFTWIFMIFGAFALVGLVLGLFGFNFNIALYGLETNSPLTAIGLLITILFLMKGVVSFALWTEIDWAVRLAIVDAILGIALCAIVTLSLPSLINNGALDINLRLELILLIPYLIALKKMSPEWDLRKP